MANILVNNNFYQGTSSACIVDLTPPTFAGINFLDVESRGQIRAGWSAATDGTSPIRYEIYIKASTSSGLFSTTNIIAVTPNLQYDIFTLPDGSFLVNGTTYYVGVRAIDGVNNRDSNTISQSVISTGVLTSIDVYESKAAWSINENNEFVLTAWANKNNSLAISPVAILGTASYQVFDKSGVAVVGMSGTGVSANSQGLFVFSPVNNLIEAELEHYEIRVSITIDSEIRTNFVPLLNDIPQYEVKAAFSINSNNQLIGSLFALSNGESITTLTRITNGHYHVYDSNGNAVPGLTESGISPNVDGIFIITPVSASSLNLQSSLYFVYIRIEIDGIPRETRIALTFGVPQYETKAQFSINATNQLQATFWVTSNGVVKTSSLGTANYTVYDSSGAVVVGLSQTGITADVNGRFQITPVSAILLTDLTHYSVKVGIVVDGAERVAYKGFTLLGT